MHNIRTTIIACVSLLPVMTFGQYPGYRQVPDPESFKTSFSAGSLKVSAITSDFKQVKTLTALTEKMTSTGKFWFKRSNKVRLEYTKPFTYLLIINGDKIFVKDDQKESHINGRSSRLFKQINQVMMDCIQGNILGSKDFNTRIFQDDGTFLLEMTPVSKTLGQFFKTIVLAVDKNDFSVKTLLMNESMGDTTLITFENKKLNEQIPDAVFAP